MKFLIIGFGSIGRRHFRNLVQLGQQDILFYRTGQSTLPDAEAAGFPVETSLDAALAHHPDAVIVANPTALHLEAALAAARQGCQILLEKPISDSMERVDELASISAEKGVKVLVGYQYRFHPNLHQIKRLLSEGAIGLPLSFRSHWGEYLPAWHPWENYRASYSARNDLGGGVVLTLSHSLDYLNWLFGKPELKWSLLGYHSSLNIEVEDTAEIGLIFDNNLIGSLHLNYTEIPSKHTLDVVGTKGSIHWDYYSNSVITYVLEKGNLVQKIQECPAGFDRNDLFLDEMKHFINVVNRKADPLCTLEDGIIALKLAILAKEQANK